MRLLLDSMTPGVIIPIHHDTGDWVPPPADPASQWAAALRGMEHPLVERYQALAEAPYPKRRFSSVEVLPLMPELM